MKRPSFQFYPADWRSNANLGRCSFGARGAWLDVMCVLHDSDEQYGVVRWPLKELANSAKVPLALLRELVDKSVLKGADKGAMVQPFVYVPRSGRKDGTPVVLIAEQPGPVWFSSRMVKDEHVRHIRGEGTRFVEGDEPSPKAEPKATPKATPKASPIPPLSDGSSSSSSATQEKSYRPSASSPEPTRAPTIPCPYAEIVARYHDALPGLPKVKLMPEDRQRAMRKRWGWVLSSSKSDGARRAETAEQALAWFETYFARASENDFLTGRGERSGAHATWQCDLDFLLTDRGMKQVIEKTRAAA